MFTTWLHRFKLCEEQLKTAPVALTLRNVLLAVGLLDLTHAGWQELVPVQIKAHVKPLIVFESSSLGFLE